MKFTKRKNFIYGVAISACQAEGNVLKDVSKHNIWTDALLHNNKVPNKFDPNITANFYDSYEQYCKVASEYGIKHVRLSIAWNRIFPSNNKDVNKKAVKHYHDLFKTMEKYNITPNVTLHHFDTPLWASSKQDFLNKQTIDDFVKYAKFCFHEFKEVKLWSTINEIQPYSSDKFLKGAVTPFEKNNFLNYFQHMYNMLIAHAKVVLLFKKEKIKGKIGIPSNHAFYYSLTSSKEDKQAQLIANTFYNNFLFDIYFKGELSPLTIKCLKTILKDDFSKLKMNKSNNVLFKKAAKNLDWFGFNYYMSWWVSKPNDKTITVFNNTGNNSKIIVNYDNLFKLTTKPNIKLTKWGWPIYPIGLSDLIKTIVNKYGFKKEIYITENGIGEIEQLNNRSTVIDTYRINYITNQLNELFKLISNNYNVKGYYLWSWMDVFSWTNGYNKRYGLFYVDFKTQKFYPKKSAVWWKKTLGG